MVLSETQLLDLWKVSGPVKAIRRGIDEELREMVLEIFAWSKNDGEIKVDIALKDKKDKEEITNSNHIRRNLSIRSAEHDLMLKELLALLVSEGILKEEKVEDIKAKITEERIGCKRLELGRVNNLDDFKSLEEK